MKKLLFRLILLLVVLVVLAGLLVVLFINPLAKSAVQEGSSYALGVETKVDDAEVSILGGQVLVTGLDISNPEGFASPRFVRPDSAFSSFRSAGARFPPVRHGVPSCRGPGSRRLRVYPRFGALRPEALNFSNWSLRAFTISGCLL